VIPGGNDQLYEEAGKKAACFYCAILWLLLIIWLCIRLILVAYLLDQPGLPAIIASLI